jgi:ATP-dependent DNA helicase RecG
LVQSALSSKSILISQTYAFAGTVTLFQNKKTIIAPEYGPYNTGKIIPIYPETRGLTSKWFRRFIQTNIAHLIQSLPDLDLPASILQKHLLLSKSEALKQLHTPQNETLLTQARYRLALDEIISIQAQSVIQKRQWSQKIANRVLKMTPQMAKRFDQLIKSLPFKLTASQIKVWHQILSDLVSSNPGNRLLQGDVGSGKTIIALLACFCPSQWHPVAFIAPTEILANQHLATFQKFLAKQKVKNSPAHIFIQTFSPPTQRCFHYHRYSCCLFQKQRIIR